MPASPTRSSSASSARSCGGIQLDPELADSSAHVRHHLPDARRRRLRSPGCRHAGDPRPARRRSCRRARSTWRHRRARRPRRRRSRSPTASSSRPPRWSSPPRVRRPPGCSGIPDVESKSVGARLLRRSRGADRLEARGARRHRSRPRVERCGDEQRGAHLRTAGTPPGRRSDARPRRRRATSSTTPAPNSVTGGVPLSMGGSTFGRTGSPTANPVNARRSIPSGRVHLDDGRFVCGDHRDTASIQGAMFSGRRCGLAVAAAIGHTVDHG